MEDTLVVLIPIIAVFFGGLAILIPVAGLTARFTLKPMMDAFTTFRAGEAQHEAIEMLERRVALLEEEHRSMQRALALARGDDPSDPVAALERGL